MYCSQPTIFENGTCSDCADLGQSGFWTDCCMWAKWYNDGCVCREIPANYEEPYFCPPEEIECKVRGETCGFYDCSSDTTVRWVDDCCYPMVCTMVGIGGDEDVDPMYQCVGQSGDWQQCSTTDCKPGLFCNWVKQCVACLEKGNFCDLTQDQCCDGLECVFDAVSVSWECLPCIALGSPCQPESEDASVCCGDSNFCVIENVGEHGYCKHCALTGQSCQSDEECYYNNAEINKNICSSGVCINAEKGGHICSGLYQICVAQTGYTVDCCENLNCEPIGTCS